MNLHVSYTQAGRMTAVSTRLGPDVLLLDGLDVDEAVMAVTLDFCRDSSPTLPNDGTWA